MDEFARAVMLLVAAAMILVGLWLTSRGRNYK